MMEPWSKHSNLSQDAFTKAHMNSTKGMNGGEKNEDAQRIDHKVEGKNYLA